MPTWANGKKTYAIAAILFILGGAKSVGWLDEGSYNALFALLTPLGLATLRHGLNKS